MAETVHFLLVYSFDEQRLVEQREFTTSREATDAYDAAERLHRGESKFEIVLVGSDSIDTIRQTHGHYFGSSGDSLFSAFLSPALV